VRDLQTSLRAQAEENHGLSDQIVALENYLKKQAPNSEKLSKTINETEERLRQHEKDVKRIESKIE
jgi:flagellar biosynthesis chaperone FliJ